MPVSPALLKRQRLRAQKGGGAGWAVFNPGPGLRIGGVDYSTYEVAFSVSARFTISPYAGVFRCQLDGPAATMAQVKVEQELTFNRNGVQYAGRVRSVTPADQVVASANRTLTIECQDFTTLLDADVCAYAVSAPQVSPSRTVVESDAQRITWLLKSFGRQGITLHHVAQNYATVPATDYTGMTLRKAIESVLAYSGASYYVDYAKDLHCFLDEKQYAPFWLVETPDDVTGSTDYRQVLLSTSPRGLWLLNDLGAVALDSSGNGNNGSITGDISPTNSAVIDRDGAMLFGGVNGDISVPFNASLAPPTTWSVAASFYMTAFPATGNACLVDARLSTTNGFALMVSSTGITVAQIGTGAGQTQITGPAFTLNARHRLVLTYNGTNARLYLDGVLVAGPVGIAYSPNPSQAIHLGRNIGGGIFYAGTESKCGIWDVELSAAQVAADFRASMNPSAPYADLALPADSVDMRNAVYGIPGALSAPAAADQITITPSVDPAFLTNEPGVLAVFKRASSAAQIARVGVAGAFLTGTNTAVSPAFGQATSAGNHLVAFVDSDSADATTAAAGWIQAVALRTATGLASSIWYKENCGAGEAAPAFTAAGGLGPMTAQLVEFSGVATSNSLDQVISGSTTAVSLTLTAPAIDAGAGELVVVSSHWGWGSNVVVTFAEAFNNKMTGVHVGDDGAVNQNHHASHVYAIGAITGALPRWYTDEASIALYGRRETAFTDTTITTQADLDAKGAAALAASSQPRQEGTFKCRRVGLAVGQRFTIQSSLYTIPVIADALGNYSGIVQAVEVTYPEDESGPVFAVEFMKPTITLAVQLGGVVASIADATAAAPATGVIGYAEMTTPNQTGLSAVTDLTGLAVTVTFGLSRRIQITAEVLLAATVSGDTIFLRLYEGTTLLKEAYGTIGTTGFGGVTLTLRRVLSAPTAGTHTYKLAAGYFGTGTFQTNFSATDPAFIEVEDIGPA